MEESNLSKNPFELSLTQSPFVDDQASAHDVMPRECLQDFPPQQTEIDWTRSATMTTPVDDTSWAYLGQFLNLSDVDLMPDT